MRVVQSCPRPSTDVGALQAAVFDVSVQYRGLAFGSAKRQLLPRQMRQWRRRAQIFRLRRLIPRRKERRLHRHRSCQRYQEKAKREYEGCRVQSERCYQRPRMCWLTYCLGLPWIGSDDARFGSVYVFADLSHGGAAPYAPSGRGAMTAACFVAGAQRPRPRPRLQTTAPRSRSL